MTERPEYRQIGKRVPRPDAIEKVQGKARYGADLFLPGMLTGKVLRSPCAHANIRSINTDRARAVKGVMAVITGRDMPWLDSRGIGETARDNLAVEKVLYHGHAVAAVAATSESAAAEALALIEVDYESLPVVLTIEDAQRDETLLHEHLGTNTYIREEDIHGDIDAGFREADVIVERSYRTPTVHQGYIEPPACLANWVDGGQSTLWTTTQGHFVIRQSVARMLEMEQSALRVIPTEIGGGFGGKTAPYQEAIALMLSRHAGRPVKMAMTREDIFRTAGPGAGAIIRARIGARNDGTLTAMEAELIYESGAFPAAPLGGGMRCIFASYTCPNISIKGSAVVNNKPKIRAYRGPGASQSTFASESLLNELAARLNMDPIKLRLKNAVEGGMKTPAGTFLANGFRQCLEAARDSAHYQAPLAPNQGRAVAAGFWRNGGNVSSALIHLHADGTAVLTTGSSDLSGTRIALAQMAAEELGVDVSVIQSVVGDTEAVGFTSVSGGSRTINATGQAVVEASREAIQEMKQRAASGWNITADQVDWRDGQAVNLTNGETLSMKQINKDANNTGGPITGHHSLNVRPGQSPSFAVHICDIEVDPDTGQTRLLRYTTIQDVGCAIHPDSVEGQLQGGAVQGIGWALNEEYIYDDQGVLQNPGFLDYRIPLASDLPMIDTVLVEVPSPNHPYGVRGVGEAPIIPPLAAVGSAIANAIGQPVTELPCSPPRVLNLLMQRP
ncbi:MAG: xanthine dehydrogenase family protein molybdopterin-binding subunit [Pseudomonadales bacterium]|nr:xanthine dehydrogenase family protein molybdopterin-binding subunit [Pseudomonadales bacterium]